MWTKRWRSLWNPDMYHGWGKSKNYFEGWYFKLVDANEQFAMAIIPGISMSADGQSHAFIQVLDGISCQSKYYKFDPAEFKPSETDFEVDLGKNYFSRNSIQLDLPDLKGSIRFKGLVPWPKMFFAPGIMGWYGFIPFMECYHGVVSMNHSLEGYVEWKEQHVTLTGGKGYLEKDWGRSFPNSWIWMQSNHFDQENVSFMASVARIPWLGNSFVGNIAGLWIDGKLHRFATYLGTRVKRAKLNENSLDLEFRQKDAKLNVYIEKGKTGKLISPASGEMIGKVNESMTATVSISFTKNNRLIFEGVGRNAGFEIGGDYQELLTEPEVQPTE